MPLYESVFIARQDIPSQEVDALATRFAEIVTDQGGKVEHREYWGLKNLSYRIRKNRKGHYTMMHLDAPSKAVHEMERNMRISEDVLRYMTVRIAEISDQPSIMMQTRSARDDRGRRDDRRTRSESGSRRGEREGSAKGASTAMVQEARRNDDAEAKPKEKEES